MSYYFTSIVRFAGFLSYILIRLCHDARYNRSKLSLDGVRVVYSNIRYGGCSCVTFSNEAGNERCLILYAALQTARVTALLGYRS